MMRNKWLFCIFLILLLIPLSVDCVQTNQSSSLPTTTDSSKLTQQPASTTSTATQTVQTETKPSYIPWNTAKDHIGEYIKVCGPVSNVTWATASKGKPTFINIGNAYPNPNRFVALIWNENRAQYENMINSMYYGRNVCVTGLIKLYSGIPEIEVTSPSQIEIR